MSAPMNMERLSMVAPELAEDLRSLGEAECRKAASVGVSIVVERAGLDDQRVERALGLLRRGCANAVLCSELQRWAEELDEEYWSLQDAYGEGRAAEEDYLAAFGRARAVSAVACALHSDARYGVLEAVYEAHCAFTDGSGVIDAVTAAVRS